MASLPKSMPASKPISDTRTTSLAEAKANLSALIRSVEHERAEIVVERRGVPVAKIIPFSGPDLSSGYGWMRGTVQELGDIVGPTGEEWDAHDE
jgi:prevent-host-death family protein